MKDRRFKKQVIFRTTSKSESKTKLKYWGLRPIFPEKIFLVFFFVHFHI